MVSNACTFPVGFVAMCTCTFPAHACLMHTVTTYIAYLAWHRTKRSSHVQRPHLPPGPPQEASEGTLEKLPEGTVSTSGATGVEAKQPSRWRRHSATSPPNSNGRSVSKLKHLHPPSRDSSAVKQAEVTHAEFERKMREGEPQKPQFVANAPQVCCFQRLRSLHSERPSMQTSCASPCFQLFIYMPPLPCLHLEPPP